MLNKVPVFYIPHHPAHPNAATATPELNIKEFPNQNFLTFWKPVSSLELDIWHRWLHAHRIHILLNNDHPLPKVSFIILLSWEVFLIGLMLNSILNVYIFLKQNTDYRTKTILQIEWHLSSSLPATYFKYLICYVHLIKFRHSEKATKLKKILFWLFLSNVKTSGRFFQIFVTF